MNNDSNHENSLTKEIILYSYHSAIDLSSITHHFRQLSNTICLSMYVLEYFFQYNTNDYINNQIKLCNEIVYNKHFSISY